MVNELATATTATRKQVILNDDRPIQDKLRVYIVQMDISFSDTNRPAEAAMLCLDVMKEYGCYFPESYMATKVKNVATIGKRQ
jgi:hypothetical protein